MTVRISPFFSRQGVARSFSDNFNRANVSYGFGEDWMFTSAVNFAQFSNSVTFGLNGNAVLMRNSGSVLVSNSPRIFVPTPIIPGLYYGQSQFSQATFISNGSVSGSRLVWGGIACCVTTQNSALRCYEFLATQDRIGVGNESIGVYRRENNTRTVLFESAGPADYVSGDVFRLEVRIGAVQNEIDVFINGVAVTPTLIDIFASRPITGAPGLTLSAINTNVVTTTDNVWDDFSCGAL